MKIAKNLEIFKEIIEKSPNAILIINASEQSIIYHNQLAEDFFGEDLNHLIKKETYHRLLCESEIKFQLKSSTHDRTRIGAVSMRTMSWDRTPNEYRILYIHDITDIMDQKEKPYLDELTGIPERNLFKQRLKEAITLTSTNQGAFGLLYLDLDGFKPVNDTFGHSSGDIVLKIVTKRIKACVRDSDTIGRLGGDEFAIILLNIKDPENAGKIANKIIHSLEQEMEIEKDKTCFISASVGISIYPLDGNDYETLIKNADRAMYVVKHDRGKGGYAYYSDGIVEQYQNKKNIESGIKKAIKDPNQFILHFMPQIDMVTGCLSAVETLTYWKPPNEKLRFPYEFIPMVDNTNLIISIEQFVFSKAGLQILEWQQKINTIPPFRLIVNLSSRHFTALNSMETINHLIENIGLEPRLLDLEITESIMLHDPKAMEILLELKNKQVSLTLDNYGSDTTSMLSLKRFPITAIKIDRVFIRNILKEKIDKAIVKNTIRMANEIGLKTIAQGVESEAQLEMLLNWGCHEAQGYLFSKPLPAKSFSQYMKEFQPSMLLRRGLI